MGSGGQWWSSTHWSVQEGHSYHFIGDGLSHCIFLGLLLLYRVPYKRSLIPSADFFHHFFSSSYQPVTNFVAWTITKPLENQVDTHRKYLPISSICENVVSSVFLATFKLSASVAVKIQIGGNSLSCASTNTRGAARHCRISLPQRLHASPKYSLTQVPLVSGVSSGIHGAKRN